MMRDWLLRFHSFNNMKQLRMSMSKNRCSYYMLEPVNQSMESLLKRLNTVFLARRMMRKNNRNFSLNFHISQSFLKPSQLMRLISQLSKKIKIPKIALLQVHSNHPDSLHFLLKLLSRQLML